MAKFKKGDKVRVKSTSGMYVPGQVYTISNPNAGQFSSGYVKFAELDTEYPHHNCAEDHLELVQGAATPKFKKGDRVRRLGDNFGLAKVGEVYTVAGYRGRLLLLEGDECTGGCPYSYKEDSFELVQPPKEFRLRRAGENAGLLAFDTAEAAAEHIRDNGVIGRDYEIVEVSVVQTVTPRRTLEVKQ